MKFHQNDKSILFKVNESGLTVYRHVTVLQSAGFQPEKWPSHNNRGWTKECGSLAWPQKINQPPLDPPPPQLTAKQSSPVLPQDRPSCLAAQAELIDCNLQLFCRHPGIVHPAIYIILSPTTTTARDLQPPRYIITKWCHCWVAVLDCSSG